MRAIIQRVSDASVSINKLVKSRINSGLLIFIGIVEDDTQEDIKWLSSKISTMRIFNDAEEKMNLSVKDIGGDILIVSQFTLHASTKKGNRPSFIKAAKPEIAISLYESLISNLERELNKKIFTGTFGADMKIALTNEGPVTIQIDSKNKE